MKMHSYYLIFPFCLVVIGITFWHIVHYKDCLPNQLTGSDGKWNFKDWATPLISIAAGLDLILALIVKDSLVTVTITSISLLCGGLILILPLVYTTLCEPAQRVWTFLIFASLMLWSVGLELIVAAEIADDNTPTNVPIPPLAIHAFRTLMIIAAAFTLLYYWKTSSQLLKPLPKEQATTEWLSVIRQIKGLLRRQASQATSKLMHMRLPT